MNVVVIGAQWGDEGKGKIVDFLAEDAEVIVRFSGGANAGHTIVAGETTYKLHLVPSGIIYPGKTVILGTGMVIDPEALFSELETLTEQGIAWEGRVLISDRAHLVLPRYKRKDREMEQTRRNPIGTTGRGIGITYAQKATREGLRVVDLYDEDQYAGLRDEDREFLDLYRERMRGMTVDMVTYLHERKDRHILYEGAQGTLLDLDNGTYPFVSSGVSCAAGVSSGGGIGPRRIDRILGVFKAYSTRVGNGPFPSEFRPERDGDLGDRIRELGREYGVTTGRPRRCGYLDLVALRYACITNSIDSLVMTHLDVYDTMDRIEVCTAYRVNGKETKEFPASINALWNAEPVTKTFPGWKTPLGGARSLEDLPDAARNYLSYIEEYAETPIGIVSVGYERTQTIVRVNPWTRS
jgi:adenylosuccinate synthase